MIGTSKIKFGFLLILIYSFSYGAAHSDHLPLWEIHAGVAAIQVPHYRGSESEHSYAIPFPGIIYRGEKLKASEDGVKGILYSGDRHKLDISLASGLPASSDENDARAGMPRLEPTIEIGPSVISELWHSNEKDMGVWLNLPLRMAFSFDDLDVSDKGLIFSPFIKWQLKENNWKWGVALGVSYADENYHNYFYEVDGQYETATRPEYHASSGYSGTRITLSATKRFKQSWFAAFARFEDLRNTVFEDSPLVERNDYMVFGLVYTYLIAQSEESSHHSEHIINGD